MLRLGTLGDVVVDRSVDRYGPADVGRLDACRIRRRVERRHFNIGEVPVPGIWVFPEGIKYGVVDDAMLGRPDSGDHGGMTWVGDSRQDADDALCVGTLREKETQNRNLQIVLVSLRDVLGLHAIDRDEDERWRFLSRKAGGRDRNGGGEE